jgi:hypothetical protein
MVDISSLTTHKVVQKVQKKPPSASLNTKAVGKKAPTKGGKAPGRRGGAPPLKPATLNSEQAIQGLVATSNEDRKIFVTETFRKALGENSVLNISAPHAASTTRDRSGAAADLAVAAKELGVRFVLRECDILDHMQRMLFPEGIEAIFAGRENDPTTGGGLKASVSAVSLASMDNASFISDNNSMATDSKRGKSTPPNAREGCLLIIRALCEIVGKKAEPYVVGAFLAAALDECGSSSSAVREAAEDSAAAQVALASPWAFSSIIAPLLLQALNSTEWRVKASALERLRQCTETASARVYHHIPTLIPAVVNQVWDTKAQVSKGAREAMLAICMTNTNPDIKATVPAVVNAMCAPSETNKAISALMGTTFVVPVDASTLAILCPVLARALKEKLAIHKRAACVVIANMSKLVDSPEAVAPFGSLLVPELKKVSENVQFDEIRDEALKALALLTKALGDLYKGGEESGEAASQMANDLSQVQAEQERIKAEREAVLKKDEDIRKKEEAEKAKFKIAMDAQRELERIELKEAEQKKVEEQLHRDKQRLSTKSEKGTCQGCGLKKCLKTCMFYGK